MAVKLSTKGRYGARAMLDVALQGNRRLAHLKDIAERQQISRKYLDHIVDRLEASGLLRTVRGAGGGVALAKPPSEITLLDILRALEGPLSFVECVEHPQICSRSGHCATRDFWQELGELVTGFLASVTLEDVCNRQRQKDGPAAPTYSI